MAHAVGLQFCIATDDCSMDDCSHASLLSVSVTEPAEASADVDDSDTEEHYSGVTAALSKAQEVFDFMDVPQKRCHCHWHCKMGSADTRCIDGFSNQEQDSVLLFYQFIVRRFMQMSQVCFIFTG